MRKKLFIVILCAVSLGVFFIAVTKKDSVSIENVSSFKDTQQKVGIKIQQTMFEAFVSDTPELRARGLGGFTSLEANQAMLFVFDRSDIWSFWMKDMLFPIDIVWVDEQFKIVFIKTHVTPDTFPKSFSSKDPARYVLEFPSGTVNKFWFKVGDEIQIIR